MLWAATCIKYFTDPVSPNELSLSPRIMATAFNAKSTSAPTFCIMFVFVAASLLYQPLNKTEEDVILPIVRNAQRIQRKIIELSEEVQKEGKEVMDGLSYDEFAKYLEDDAVTHYSFACLTPKDRVVKGFLICRPGEESAYNKAPPGTSVAFVEKFAVRIDYRGQGIGKRMLHIFARKALKNNVDEVRLLVYRSNVDAIKKYEKWGFTYENKERDEGYDSYLLKAKVTDLFECTKPTQPNTHKR